MAPKSAAALVLLAAMIAGLAPPLQAQTGDSFFSLFDLCRDDDVMISCARQLVESRGATIPPDCCRALLKPVTSGKGTQCACEFVAAATDMLGVDVDRRCQAASKGSVAGGPSLKEFCMRDQTDDFLSVVNHVCFSDEAMKSCARQLVASEGTRIPPDCCGALLNAATSDEGKQCACEFGEVAASILKVDVDRMCQAASNVGVAGGPSKLKELCMRTPGN